MASDSPRLADMFPTLDDAQIERMRVVGHERAALTVCSTPSPHGIDSLKARLSPIAQAIRWEIPGPAVM
jgi:hypothetical protein